MDTLRFECLPERVLISLEEVTRFTVEMLFTIDTNYDNVVKMAEIIVGSDFTGNLEFGIVILRIQESKREHLPLLIYLDLPLTARAALLMEHVERGELQPGALPQDLKRKKHVAMAAVSAGRAYGMLAAERALQMACELSSRYGAALTVARECLFAGPLSWYVAQAADRGYVVLAFSDAPPSVAPCRGRKAALGANRMALGIRGLDSDRFICELELANTSWEEVMRFNECGQHMPGDWALNADGQSTTNPAAALANGALLPLGGYEQTDGHKGYGLLLLVHCLTGLLAGAPTEATQDEEAEKGAKKKAEAKEETPPGGQRHNPRKERAHLWGGSRTYTFVAFDPRHLLPGLEERTSALMYLIRHGQSPESETNQPAPFDLELENMNRVSEMGGIVYRAEVIDTLDELAKARSVSPLVRRDTRNIHTATDILGTP